jgi:hypothetical protein
MSSRRHDGLAVESENARWNRGRLTGAGARRRANEAPVLCVEPRLRISSRMTELHTGCVLPTGSSFDSQPRTRQGPAGTRAPPRNSPGTGRHGHQGPTWPSVLYTAVRRWASQDDVRPGSHAGPRAQCPSPLARAAESPTWPRVRPGASIDMPSAHHSSSTILRRVPLNRDRPDSFPCSAEQGQPGAAAGVGAAWRGGSPTMALVAPMLAPLAL